MAEAKTTRSIRHHSIKDWMIIDSSLEDYKVVPKIIVVIEYSNNSDNVFFREFEAPILMDIIFYVSSTREYDAAVQELCKSDKAFAAFYEQQVKEQKDAAVLRETLKKHIDSKWGKQFLKIYDELLQAKFGADLQKLYEHIVKSLMEEFDLTNSNPFQLIFNIQYVSCILEKGEPLKRKGLFVQECVERVGELQKMIQQLSTASVNNAFLSRSAIVPEESVKSSQQNSEELILLKLELALVHHGLASYHFGTKHTALFQTNYVAANTLFCELIGDLSQSAIAKDNNGKGTSIKVAPKVQYPLVKLHALLAKADLEKTVGNIASAIKYYAMVKDFILANKKDLQISRSSTNDEKTEELGALYRLTGDSGEMKLAQGNQLSIDGLRINCESVVNQVTLVLQALSKQIQLAASSANDSNCCLLM